MSTTEKRKSVWPPEKGAKTRHEADGKTKFTATSVGFYDGARVRVGDQFRPEKGETFTWAAPSDQIEALAEAAPNALLEKHPRVIVKELSGIKTRELKRLLAAEQSGKNRKSVVAALDDAIGARVGEIEEPETEEVDAFS